ncbi:MAG: phosphatidylglycerol lysyltransferase domain-containing protein [Tannerella sp.]|jgi:hypothetical protein|nr:phosphatidylglycerol lysyltransferase domain-containing protein [Tannerella sp.]
MMIPFKPITIEDKAVITACTYQSHMQNCDFSFTNMCSWRFLYDSEFAVVNQMLLIRFQFEDKGKRHKVYMLPVGNGDFRQAIGLLEEDARADGRPLRMLGVTPDGKEELEKYFPSEFKYIPEQDYFDYIYLRSDLQQLTGKKYQAKRNHINKFKNRYRYVYLPITPELVPLCLELECKWYQANHTAEDADALNHENRSMIFALNHFKELDLTGGAICVDNEIIAFSYGSPINHRTFGVHVEKANIRYDGIFSVINREFASRIPEQFLYVNREEDLGIPGLRQSKLSYHPTILLEKHTAIKRR